MLSDVGQNSTIIYSKLSKNFWIMLDLIENILSHCEKHEITVWLDYSTYYLVMNNPIGITSHEINFGIDHIDKNRFISTFENKIDSKISLYHLSNNKITLCNGTTIVDILMYNKIDSYYQQIDYIGEKIYAPLVRKLFIGHSIWVSHRWISNPINLVTREFSIEFSKSIPRHYCETFESIRKLIENSCIPVIIETSYLDLEQSDYEKLIDNQKRNIYGYQSSITWKQSESDAITTWKNYKQRKLDFNIVDSPIDDKTVLPNEWNTYVKDKLGNNYDFALTWIMTIKPKITHFHTDPEYAGGYMKLLSGEKIWWCICPIDYQYLVDRGHSIDTMAKLNFNEVLQLENNYLIGRIYMDIIRDGDLIWFPINTLHKVITTKDSYGFGGYL